MKLYHYSKEPLGEIHSVDQTKIHVNDSRLFKPHGLWLSHDDGYGWAQWCAGEDFCLGNLAFRTPVALHEDAKILCIKDAADLDAAVEKYAYDGEPLPGLGKAYWREYGYVSWAKMAQDWQGIFIMDAHIAGRRLGGPLWYYAWDCDSACVWDTTAIAKIEESQPFNPAAFIKGKENADAAE